MILVGRAVGGKSLLVGSVPASVSGCFEGGSAAVVLVIWGHISQALVEPDRVVEDPAGGELDLELARVSGLVQVRMLAFEGSSILSVECR